MHNQYWIITINLSFIFVQSTNKCSVHKENITRNERLSGFNEAEVHEDWTIEWLHASFQDKSSCFPQMESNNEET